MAAVILLLDFNSRLHNPRNISRQESIDNIFEVARLLS